MRTFTRHHRWFPVMACLAILFAGTAPTSAQDPCVSGWVPQQFGEAPGVGNGPGVEVFDLLVHDDGSGPALFAAGFFFEAGASGGKTVARWDGSRWSALGGISTETHAIAVFDDGTGPALYEAPWFTNPIGLKRWDGVAWTITGQGLGGFVEVMLSFDDGSGPALYVGGNLSLPGGLTTGIARWTGTQWELPGDGTNGPVRTLLVADVGGGEMLFAGGAFSQAGGATARGLAAWDGSVWSSPGSINGDALAMTLHDAGGGAQLVVGGSFTQVSGVPAAGIATWDGTTWAAYGSGVEGTVSSLTSFDEGGGALLMAGGDFTSAGGVTANRIASWNGTTWQALGTGLDDDCYALEVFDDGSGPGLHAGGLFRQAGGAAAARIARWSAGTWNGLGDGFDDTIFASVIYDDGSGPALYVGGSFSTIAGLAADYLARWDGSTWSAVGTGGPTNSVRCLIAYDDGAGPQLYAGSTSVRRWNGTSWEQLPGISGMIRAFAVYDGPGFGGPLLHAAGDFGPGVYNNVARLFGTFWLTLGQGLTSSPSSGEAFDLAVYDDGSGEALYVGGVFSGSGGSGGISARNIARWNGITWSPLGAGSQGTNTFDDVHAIEVFDDGTGPKLYAKGGFLGQTLPLGVWDGTAWGDPGFGIKLYNVSEMVVLDDGSGPALYTNGSLSSSTGSSAGRVFMRFDGETLTILQDKIQGGVETMLSADFGNGPELFVGGSFQHLEDVGDSYLARWRTCLGSWDDLGGGTPGSAGIPSLTGTGPLTVGAPTTIALTEAPPSALLLAWISLAPVPFSALGGTVHAFPTTAQFLFGSDAQGAWSITTPWPASLPTGTELTYQFIVVDASVPAGITLSNGLKATAN